MANGLASAASSRKVKARKNAQSGKYTKKPGCGVKSLHLRGIVTFVMEPYTTEYMFLYTSGDFAGELSDPDSCPRRGAALD